MFFGGELFLQSCTFGASANHVAAFLWQLGWSVYGWLSDRDEVRDAIPLELNDSWRKWQFLGDCWRQKGSKGQKNSVQWDGTHFHFWTTDTKVNRPDFFQWTWKQHYTELWCNKGCKHSIRMCVCGGVICNCLCPLTSLDPYNNP